MEEMYFEEMDEEMGRKRLRLSPNAIEEDDRISTLPDALIHRILSFVDLKVAVETCVLSKRWVNIWSTLPFLNFDSPYLDEFVSDFLINRNQQSPTSSIKIDFEGFDESLTKKVVDYAISHNVEQFIISGANIDWLLSVSFPFLRELSLSRSQINMEDWTKPSLDTLHGIVNGIVCNSLTFPVLQTLRLSFCNSSILKWSFPSLTTLYLEHVTISSGERLLSFEGFYCLKELSLTCVQFSEVEVVMIKSPKLTSLTISHSYPYRPTFMVSARNLSFSFQGTRVPLLSAVNGFPSLNKVNLDIYIDKYKWKEYKLEEMKLISLFHELQTTQFLTLSFMTLKVISRFSRFSEYQPAPFGNLKSLTMLRSSWKCKCLKKLPDQAIIYLLSSSPCAKVFLEDHCGEIRNYNPEKNMLQCKTSGYPVIKYKAATPSGTKIDAPSGTKIDASNEVPKPEEVNKKTNSPHSQQATSTVQGNCDVMHRVLGVIPPAVIRGAPNDKACSYREKNIFSLWEGNQVYSKYVDLLTRIKEKHPETFEHVAPQTDVIYTMWLNAFCSLIQAFSADCGSKFTAANISRYRGLISDMDKWGFNTTWLVNHLNNIEELSYLCRQSHQ